MSFLAHALQKGVDIKLCLIFGAVILVASQIGSRLHTKVGEKSLRRGFALILVVASLWMIAKIFL